VEGMKMLIINGIIENGVFIPNQPIPIQKKTEASLEIKEIPQGEETAKQDRIKAWKEFSEEILKCDEKLTGWPEPIKHFENIENLQTVNWQL
jgi:predicted DNA-binding antitoxin AbrB/MazE fold protein